LDAAAEAAAVVARLEQEEEAAAVAALAELEQELAKEAAAARVTAREKLRARQEAVATLSEQVREGGRERETHDWRWRGGCGHTE
jgi:hypothetical protein